VGSDTRLTRSFGCHSQSGSITQRLTEYAYSLGIGTDKAVSVGNGTVLDTLSFLEFMGQDEGIRVIALYIENMRDGRRFFDLAREISKGNPSSPGKAGRPRWGRAQRPLIPVEWRVSR